MTPGEPSSEQRTLVLQSDVAQPISTLFTYFLLNQDCVLLFKTISNLTGQRGGGGNTYHGRPAPSVCDTHTPPLKPYAIPIREVFLCRLRTWDIPWVKQSPAGTLTHAGGPQTLNYSYTMRWNDVKSTPESLKTLRCSSKKERLHFISSHKAGMEIYGRNLRAPK